EHGLIRAASPADLDGRFRVGERLEIVPNHSCLTVAHFDVYHVLRGGRVVERWPIARGRGNGGPMRIILRHFLLAMLPLVFGIAAGWGVAFSLPRWVSLVGPGFGGK